MEIIPSLLTDNPQELKDLVNRCEGVVSRVHVDCIDGIFAANRTVVPSAFEYIETNLLLDFHLMVREPIHWIEKCVQVSADRIIGQIEQMKSQSDFVHRIQEVPGVRIGLAIDLETEVSRIDETILPEIDVILVMSVAAGLGGQEFDPRAISKIKELDKIRSEGGFGYQISDDGGVSLDRVDDLSHENVDEVIIGRRLFDGDLAENIQKFRRASKQ